ncbi:MAG: hypothetical protein HY020_15480 [Burkholderiales bacterium]|nr:hypothetical protein [Burkholderiales bacterium]
MLSSHVGRLAPALAGAHMVCVISTQTPEEHGRHVDDRKEFILATWEAGLGELDRLERLIEKGCRANVRGDGYPNLYFAPADVVIPLLADGPPAQNGDAIIGDDYVMPANWVGQVEIDPDRMVACPSAHRLTVAAWDLS